MRLTTCIYICDLLSALTLDAAGCYGRLREFLAISVEILDVRGSCDGFLMFELIVGGSPPQRKCVTTDRLVGAAERDAR